MMKLWQGSANQWDCDEMGHMNVRVYVDKMMEGLAVFAHHIEMADAFEPRANSTVQVAEQHIRFMREVRPGRPLEMVGGVLEIGPSDALIYQEIRHGDGTPAAAFRSRVRHIAAESEHEFAWSRRTLVALEALRVDAPAATAPRSIDPDAPIIAQADANQSAAKNVGAPQIGMGSVSGHQCDGFGRMRTEEFMGRISDSVPNLLYEWRQQPGMLAGHKQTGAAVLEYRLIYRHWPKAGDRFVVYSSFAQALEKTHSLVHWMVDPATGAAWMTSEAVAVAFDLESRKLVPTPADQITALKALAPSGLKL